MSDPCQQSSPLVEALDREIARRGHGTAAAVARALGKHRGWWHDRRRRGGDLRVAQLERAAAFLGLDLPAFVRGALDGSSQDASASTRSTSTSSPNASVASATAPGLHRPVGTPPALVEIAWRRILDDERDGGLGRAIVDELDGLRHHDAAAAWRQAESLVHDVRSDLLPDLLGVAGSTARSMFRIEQAEHLLFEAIQMARHAGREHPDLYQRMGYVLGEKQEFQAALHLAEYASVLHLRRRDPVSVSRALVDQAQWLYHLQRFHESIECATAALPELQDRCARNSCTAWQCIAGSRSALGQFDRALSALQSSDALAANADLDETARARIGWSKAQAQARTGLFEDSVRTMKLVVSHFRSRHLGEAALASCDLAAIQVSMGSLAEASSTIRGMRALIEPLQRHRRISDSLRQLLTLEQAALTVKAIVQVRETLATLRSDSVQWPSLSV
ncbi:MAG: hypothetical protein AAGC60_15035 [Acidobacteriota bacterium]